MWHTNAVRNIHIRDYVYRHTLYVVLFFVEFLMLSQYEIVLFFAEEYDGVVSKEGLKASLWIFTFAYGIVGIMLFLVFGTSASLWRIWFNLCGCGHLIPRPTSLSTTSMGSVGSYSVADPYSRRSFLTGDMSTSNIDLQNVSKESLLQSNA